MTDYPVLKNAPIVEALLDIQVLLPADTDLATLASVQDRVRERYPNRQERQHWQINAMRTNGGQPEVSQSGGPIGYAFLPPDVCQDRTFQSRLDGFTFSKFKPYEAWSKFQSEAKELWGNYVEVSRPVAVKRLALRTVNSLNLPLPFADFKEYLLTTPEVAPGIPSGLAQFFMNLAIPQPAGETATVTLAMPPLQQPNSAFVTVIFDIDVFAEQTFPPDADAIWEKCERLRQIRNDIFFSSLTEKAKELF